MRNPAGIAIGAGSRERSDAVSHQWFWGNGAQLDASDGSPQLVDSKIDEKWRGPNIIAVD
jgi:hypothetical protein